MSDTTKKVTLAFPYTDAEGKDHKVDSSVTLPRHEANRLLIGGLARDPEKPAAKKATAASADNTKES